MVNSKHWLKHLRLKKRFSDLFFQKGTVKIKLNMEQY